MYIRKVKPSGGIGGYWIPLVTLIFFILIVSFLSIKAGIVLVLLAFIMVGQYNFYTYYRTNNITYLFGGIFNLTFCGFLLFAPHVGLLGANKAIAFSSFIISVGFSLAAFSQVITGNYKWKGRDLFELAAADINESENGFTSRPHPVGTHNYTKEEIMQFVKFLQKNLIGLSLIDSKKVYFIPVKSGYEYFMLFKQGYSLLENSWISFQDDGQISVHISKADYLDYNEALSFNLLCSSMGDIFIEFLDLFLKGEGVRILDKLKKMQMGIFS